MLTIEYAEQQRVAAIQNVGYWQGVIDALKMQTTTETTTQTVEPLIDPKAKEEAEKQLHKLSDNEI